MSFFFPDITLGNKTDVWNYFIICMQPLNFFFFFLLLQHTQIYCESVFFFFLNFEKNLKREKNSLGLKILLIRWVLTYVTRDLIVDLHVEIN